MTPEMNPSEAAWQRAREAVSAARMRWTREHSAATPEIREMTKHYDALLAKANQTVNSVKSRVQQLADDDISHPIPMASRQRQASEAYAAALTEVAQLERSKTATLQVMEAHLQVKSLPKLPKDREMAARDEARMILDGSDDPVGAMLRLAQRDDEIGAVVASGWGRSYLTAKRVEKADEVAAMVGRVASSSAVESADPQRKAAGEALAALGQTIGDGSADVLVRQTLGEAAEAVQSLGVSVDHVS